jgi:hypothetical protein
MRVDWVVNPARVPKGSFERIAHPDGPHRCTCVVHDDQDKQRFIRCIERTASEIQLIRQSPRSTR